MPIKITVIKNLQGILLRYFIIYQIIFASLNTSRFSN